LKPYDAYPIISEDLAEVDRVIKERLDSPVALIRTIATYIISAGGKRLRPVLLTLFARALGEFGATLMLAGSIPGKTQTLSIAIYEAVQAGRDSDANGMVLLISAVCVAVLLAIGTLASGKIPREGVK